MVPKVFCFTFPLCKLHFGRQQGSVLYKYVRPSQVKSATTPVGEPNARAEAEKKNIDTPETVQPTGVPQKTW